MATKNAPVETPSSIITDDMFASDAIVEHEVTLGDGKKRTLYFKELSAIEWKQHMEAENSKDPKVRKESAVRLIARSLVEPDGRRALSVAQAARLKPAVSGAIFMAILRLNGILSTAPAVEADDEEGIEDEIEEDLEGDDQGN